MNPARAVLRKRRRISVDSTDIDTYTTSNAEGYTDEPKFEYTINSPVVAILNDKTFYNSFVLDGTTISVGSTVDILIKIRKNGNRDTKVGKIAAIFVNNASPKGLFVELSYFFDKNEGIVKRKNYSLPNWPGFSHHNEVVASNKFEYVEADSIDDIITVHDNFESYNLAIEAIEDEDSNVFCRYMCYNENCAIVPFENKEWENILLKYSKHYHLYVGKQSSLKPVLGRESEMNKIKSFLKINLLQQGTGQVLYVTGVPGTGKTKTVLLAIEEMVSESKLGNIPEFDLVDINATQFKDPKEIYNSIYFKLFSSKSISYHQSLKLLDEAFSKNRERPCLIVIDEVDYLLTKSQSILYTLLNWPAYPGSKAILIMISNTIDLPSKLKGSCSSRLAFGTLVFTPYTLKQVSNVLDTISEQDSDSVALCSKRVVNYCGDMRKALHIYDKACELGEGKLTLQSVSKASQSVLQSLSKKIEDLDWPYKCVLTCLINSGEEMVSLAYLFTKFVGIASVSHPNIPILNYNIYHFKLLMIKMARMNLVKLVAAVFEVFEAGVPTGKNKTPEGFMDDTGVLLIPPKSQIIVALSKDMLWGLKLQRETNSS